MAQGGDGSKTLLLKRLRCVAFAALGAGATEAELDEAIRSALDAQTRLLAARPPLQLVR